MSSESFVRRTHVEASAEEVFQWHTRPGAFERLVAPWNNIRVLNRTDGIANGARVILRVKKGPLTLHWILDHHDYFEGRQFRDVQVTGPFERWEHTHRFEPDGDNACYLQDRIEYSLPFGPVGELLGNAFVKNELERCFVYRHRTIKNDMSVHAAYRDKPRMRILVSGSSGLIGSALVHFLTTGGHTVMQLTRGPRVGVENTIPWQPDTGRIHPAALEGFDAVIHLAGESLSAVRWSAEKKKRIRDSRSLGTRLLCETLAKLNRPPKVLLSASAIGFYGNRGGEILHEDSDSGAGFLPSVCRDWEAATKPAADKGIRVVNLRTGIVLSAGGGMLSKVLTPFCMGLGGTFGAGWQYMSWIAIDDVIGAIYHSLMTDKLSGPVNVVGPYVALNRDFAKALGRVLDRPSFCRIPAVVAHTLFGQMADEMMLASARVEPRRLLDTGYVFHYPELEGALRHVLGRA
jgi:uncharacterized protein